MRIVLVTAGLVALVGSAAARPPTPQTLRRSSGPIAALAQDGESVAWLAPGGRRCNTVQVLGAAETESAPDPAAGSLTCYWNLSAGPPRLALAAQSSEVLWTLHENGSSPFDYVLTAQLGGAEQRLDRLAHSSDGTGLWLGGVAGAGSTLAYSVVDVEYADKVACLSGEECKRVIAGGGIRTVADGTATNLPNAGPALELSAEAGRIAYVPASVVGKSGAPAASAAGPVDVVDATSGVTVCTLVPAGVPVAISLSASVLAVLTRSGGRKQLSWYDAGTCTANGNAAVSRRAAAPITVDARVAVFRIGRTLRGLTLRTARSRLLARTRGRIAGLSLASGNLVWAENVRGGGRIRSLAVG